MPWFWYIFSNRERCTLNSLFCQRLFLVNWPILYFVRSNWPPPFITLVLSKTYPVISKALKEGGSLPKLHHIVQTRLRLPCGSRLQPRGLRDVRPWPKPLLIFQGTLSLPFPETPGQFFNNFILIISFNPTKSQPKRWNFGKFYRFCCKRVYYILLISPYSDLQGHCLLIQRIL